MLVNPQKGSTVSEEDKVFSPTETLQQRITSLGGVGVSFNIVRPDQEVLLRNVSAAFFDADGTIYDTEEALYASSTGCYARVIRKMLQTTARFGSLVNDDTAWNEFWRNHRSDVETNSPGSFTECLKRGLDGDVRELVLFINKSLGNVHIPDESKTAWENGSFTNYSTQSKNTSYDGDFSVVPAVFKQMVQAVQSDDVQFKEMMENATLIPNLIPLVMRVIDANIPCAVASAAPTINTIRATQHFTLTDVPGDDAGEYVGKRVFDLFNVVIGDCLKIKKENGHNLWVNDGYKSATRELQNKCPNRGIRRATSIVIGDTHSDLGGAILNGNGAVFIRIPEGSEFNDQCVELLKVVQKILSNQSKRIDDLKRKARPIPTIYIISDYNQIRFDNTNFDPANMRAKLETSVF